MGNPPLIVGLLIACLSFDLLVAAYIAISYAVGQLRGSTSSRRRRVA